MNFHGCLPSLYQDTHKSGGYVVGKFFGDYGKASRQKSGVAHGFDYSHEKRQRYKSVSSFDPVEQTENNCADTDGENSSVEHELWSYFVELIKSKFFFFKFPV